MLKPTASPLRGNDVGGWRGIGDCESKAGERNGGSLRAVDAGASSPASNLVHGSSRASGGCASAIDSFPNRIRSGECSSSPFSSLLPPCPFVPTRALLPPSLYPPPPPSLFRHPSRLSHIGCRRERTRCKTRIALIARPRAMQKSLRDEMTNVILEDRGDDYLDGNLSSQSIAEDVRESGVRRVDCLLA